MTVVIVVTTPVATITLVGVVVACLLARFSLVAVMVIAPLLTLLLSLCSDDSNRNCNEALNERANHMHTAHD